MARDVRLVRAGGAEFYVQVSEVGDGGFTGPVNVGVRDVLSFDGVREMVEGVCGEFAGVWRRVRPAEASVEFEVGVAARSGKLIGLLGEGDGSARLKVSMTWRAGGEAGEVDAGDGDGDEG